MTHDGQTILGRAGLAAVAAVITLLGFLHLYRQYYAAMPESAPDLELYPVRGIDISSHNGEVDFSRVAADGYEFVIAKATEGADFKDRLFVDNIRRAREAGMKVGAYHFFRFDIDGDMQAINFLNSLRGRQLDIPAVIDVEDWGNPDGNATSRIVGRLRQMIEHLEYYGTDIILYTNKDAYDRYIRGNFDDYPLWICSLKGDDPAMDWVLWQYSHSGHVDGVRGNVDINTIKEPFWR